MAPAGRDRTEVHLDGELLGVFRLPLLDGARELLRRGYDPAAMLTARWRGSTFDAFRPAPIGTLARWTITERDKDGLRLEKWRALPRGVAQDARRSLATMREVSGSAAVTPGE